MLNWQDTVSSAQVTLRGTMWDQNYATTLSINGVTVATSPMGVRGSWAKAYTLDVGENVFTFTLTSAGGGTVTETRTVVFTPLPPELVFVFCPETARGTEILLRGKVLGNNAGARLFINGEEARLEYDHSFASRQPLSPGVNTFVFRAVNSDGQEVTVTRTVERVDS